MSATGRKGVKARLYGVILAGGVGTRFWPLSRRTTPKQLLGIVGRDSLLKATIKRLRPLVAPERTFVVTNAEQAWLIETHLGADDTAPAFVIEPMGRNTAPAIGLAAMNLVKEDPEAVMAVLPADHMIKEAAAFRKALRAAAELAAEGGLVTFGIVPTRPETGYGYIKARRGEEKVVGGITARPVERFVEKPDLKKARAYLRSGSYYWNSGIFVWKAARILEEMAEHLPSVYRGLERIRNGADAAREFRRMEDISIDYGILEKTRGIVVLEAPFTWSDLGSWSSLRDVMKTDKAGNIVRGRAVDIGSSGSIIIASERLVATIGLKDMVVVDTDDSTLVCPVERAQQVKDMVGLLKKKGMSEHIEHPRVERPWGWYKVLEEGEGFKVKRIGVRPGCRLSLQYHRSRSEHWVVVRGTARVRCGDRVLDLEANESVFIPRGELHRLENSGAGPLEVVEVQSGDYLGEDDIVRIEDDYKRIQ
ncbi:MAG TPA: mannose-1-phosphate guanylyltransferase/mannose-6-phosphate isomerase [Deltaproteobacteria bacterium]|nr:mannose-1-phosphate guanylyltransferase/mannose-6-phosphate isomerase [Deltaproteobacteria bacterium]